MHNTLKIHIEKEIGILKNSLTLLRKDYHQYLIRLKQINIVMIELKNEILVLIPKLSAPEHSFLEKFDLNLHLSLLIKQHETLKLQHIAEGFILDFFIRKAITRIEEHLLFLEEYKKVLKRNDRYSSDSIRSDFLMKKLMIMKLYCR